MSGRDDPSGGEDRSAAEWVTFTIAAVVILALVVLIGMEIPQSRRPAEPVAEATLPLKQGEVYAVPVVVENRGEETAENVQVRATLTIDGQDHEGDQVIDFLSGGEQEELVFVFDDDPGDGKLEVRVTGYTMP